MNEPTKQGVNISGGDKGVDHSQTTVDNSSRVTNAHDDHSVHTTTVTDNSSRVTNMSANDNRRKSHISVSGGAAVALAALVVVVVLVMWLVPRGGVAPASAGSIGPPPASKPVDVAALPAAPVPAVAMKQAANPPRVAAEPRRETREPIADFVDVEASGQPQDGLAPGSREAYGDAIDTAMLLAKAHFLAWQRGEITHVREIEGIKTLRADTMLIAKGQVRGGRMTSQSSLEEFQKDGVVRIKVRFPVSADVTPPTAK